MLSWHPASAHVGEGGEGRAEVGMAAAATAPADRGIESGGDEDGGGARATRRGPSEQYK